MNDFLSALNNVNIEIPNSTDLKVSLIFYERMYCNYLTVNDQ